MRVRDADLLKRYITQKDVGYARAGRYADVSRQFVWQLANGEKATCSDEVGQRIEELAGVLEGTLFVREGSRTARRSVPGRATATVSERVPA